MSTTPENLKYTDSHEWVRQEADGLVTIGITFHAQDMLGDVVFVENPKPGRKVAKGEECGVIESVKAAADIYSPLTGEIAAVNERARGRAREDQPGTVCRMAFSHQTVRPGRARDAARRIRLSEAR